MDAVQTLISALEADRALEPEAQVQLLAEVVALSQRGLAINDPIRSRRSATSATAAPSQPWRLPASTTPG